MYFLSKIGLKKKTKMKETSFRRKKFFYNERIKIKGTFSGPNVRCGEQLKAFTVNSRQCCQLVSICASASARLVYCAPKYCHVTPSLRELHWLSVRLRVDFKVLLVTFKILHGVTPIYLKDLVSVLPDSRYQLRRNNNGILLERPRLRKKKTLGDRALSMAAPFLWNSLPLPIRQETSIHSFKRSVKTYLFKKAFS